MNLLYYFLRNQCCFFSFSIFFTTYIQKQILHFEYFILPTRNQVYALGGFNGITRMNTGERYNPATNSWQTLPDMDSPRSNFALEVTEISVKHGVLSANRSAGDKYVMSLQLYG